jgi:lysozyme
MKKFRIILFISVPLLLLVGYFFFRGFYPFNYPSREKFPVWGIDISHHQGKIDWKKLKSEDLTFVYMKATEGGDYKDSAFTVNWDSAIANGYTVGAYHYFNFLKTGKEQAENFIATVPEIENEMPPALDLEFGGTNKSDQLHGKIIFEIHEFIDIIKNHYGKRPVIYSTHEFYNEYLKDDFKDCIIWIRDIFSEPTLPGKRKWAIWQFSSRENLNGIEGNVDENVFYGTKNDFENFLQRR